MKSKISWLAAPYVVWMALFTVIPIMMVVFYAFTFVDPNTGDFVVGLHLDDAHIASYVAQTTDYGNSAAKKKLLKSKGAEREKLLDAYFAQRNTQVQRVRDQYLVLFRGSFSVVVHRDGEMWGPLDALLPLLRKLPRNPVALLPQTPFHPCEKQDEVETMDVSQGKLCMGFVTPVTNRCADFAAMQILNVIYGSGMTSKLFVNVREKMSLCYSIGSGYYGTKGILVVSAGIDFDKEQLTRQEVLRQLQLCRDGGITDQELHSAKEALLSSLRGTHDSPCAIEGYYSTAALSGLIFSHGDYMRAVEEATLEQVVACAKSLELHTSYFLKGGSK